MPVLSKWTLTIRHPRQLLDPYVDVHAGLNCHKSLPVRPCLRRRHTPYAISNNPVEGTKRARPMLSLPCYGAISADPRDVCSDGALACWGWFFEL